MININYVEIKAKSLTKNYRFLHLSDLHLSLCDSRETERRINHAIKRNTNFTKDGVPPDKRFDEYIEYIKERSDENHPEHLDGVLFTGDIMDFPSKANLEYLDKKLSEIDIPIIFTLGNHDWSFNDDYQSAHAKVFYRPLFLKWCGGNTFINKTHIGELCFITLDNTQGFYEDGVETALENMLENEKNVFILQHIPMYVDTLHDDTVARWKKDKNIGSAECSTNDNWEKIRDLISNPKNSVLGIITGHLHFHHTDMFTDNTLQLVTDIAARANASVITVSAFQDR